MTTQDTEKRSRREIGFWAAMISICASLGFDISTTINAQDYVQKNLSVIMKEQENVLGIKHIGTPTIIIDSLQQYVPADTLGLYFSDFDRIYLRPLAVTPEDNTMNFLIRTLRADSFYSLRGTLDHELGHYYEDKVLEKHGIPENPHTEIEERLIREGIADYFEHRINGGEDTFTDDEWPMELKSFDTRRLLYDGGYHLVKPIIDKYGAQGIEFLLLHLPTPKDLVHPLHYQRWVLEELEKNK